MNGNQGKTKYIGMIEKIKSELVSALSWKWFVYENEPTPGTRNWVFLQFNIAILNQILLTCNWKV